MIKFKKVSSFLWEFVGLIILTSAELFYVGMAFEIHNIGCFLIGVAVIVIAYLFVYNEGVMGALVFCDFLLQKTNKDSYEFVNALSYQASFLTAKKDENGYDYYITRYLIHVKKNEQIFTFISTEPLNMVKGERYIMTSTALSKIVLSFQYDSSF